jgi:hypothetical protein
LLFRQLQCLLKDLLGRRKGLWRHGTHRLTQYARAVG